MYEEAGKLSQGRWRRWKEYVNAVVKNSSSNRVVIKPDCTVPIEESAIKTPHTYMKAVGTKELYRILEEEINR